MAVKKVSKKKADKEAAFLQKLSEYGIRVPKQGGLKEFPYMIPFKHKGLQINSGGGIAGGRFIEISGASQCLAKGTLVATLKGPKRIELIKKGEMIFGYNTDGSVSPTKVKQVFKNGVKTVYELKNKHRVLACSTLNHVWCVNVSTGAGNNRIEEHTLSDVAGNRRRRILTRHVDYSFGSVHEPHAYAIGALLSDGCCRQGINYIRISSPDDWDRESLLNLLAGLIDTDGCVTRCNDYLRLSFSSTSKDLIDVYTQLVYMIFQIKPHQDVDARVGKKVCYSATVSDNYNVTRILRILGDRILTPSKSYKPEYEYFKHHVSPEYIGVNLGKKIKCETYDLSVDNATNLYVLHDHGLVTHNSGKSFLLYELGAEVVNNMGGYFLLNDIEQAFQESYGKKVGLIPDGSRFAYMNDNSMENFFKAMRAFVEYVRIGLNDKKSPILLAGDSFAGLKVKLDLDNEEAKKDTAGYISMRTNAVFEDKISKFVGFLEKHDATFVLANQLSINYVQTHYGTEKVIQSKAEKSLSFWTTQRMRGALGKTDGSSAKIMKEVPSTSIKKKNVVLKQIGVWSTWEFIKNRLAPPFTKTETRIMYATGVNPNSGLNELLVNAGLIKEATQSVKLKDGSSSKTPLMGYRIVGDPSNKFYAIGKKVAKPKNSDMERAIKELLEDCPDIITKASNVALNADCEE